MIDLDDIPEIDEGMTEKQYSGRSMYNAPQPPLTAADDYDFPGVTNLKSGEVDLIKNMRTRINELEARLQKLELLK